MPTDRTRTAAILIDCPLGGQYRVAVDREDVRTYENGDAFPLPNRRRISFLASDLASRPLPGGPVLLATYADLQALLSRCGEQLEADAIAARRAFDAEQLAIITARAEANAARAAALNRPPIGPIFPS